MNCILLPGSDKLYSNSALWRVFLWLLAKLLKNLCHQDVFCLLLPLKFIGYLRTNLIVELEVLYSPGRVAKEFNSHFVVRLILVNQLSQKLIASGKWEATTNTIRCVLNVCPHNWSATMVAASHIKLLNNALFVMVSITLSHLLVLHRCIMDLKITPCLL